MENSKENMLFISGLKGLIFLSFFLSLTLSLSFFFWWGRAGVVVSALDFRSDGRWFDAQSLPSCCLRFLRQDTLPHIVPTVSPHLGV